MEQEQEEVFEEVFEAIYGAMDRTINRILALENKVKELEKKMDGKDPFQK